MPTPWDATQGGGVAGCGAGGGGGLIETMDRTAAAGPRGSNSPTARAVARRDASVAGQATRRLASPSSVVGAPPPGVIRGFRQGGRRDGQSPRAPTYQGTAP